MTSEKMAACADMILADAIEDMALEEGITLEEARDRLLKSKSCECLYDFDSGLWMEGPDYFRYFYENEKQAPAGE